MRIVIICYSVELLINWEDTLISGGSKYLLSAKSENGIRLDFFLDFFFKLFTIHIFHINFIGPRIHLLLLP